MTNWNNLKTAKGLLGENEGEQIQQLTLSELLPFENHPFSVVEDQEMAYLVESIQNQGVANPIIVRPKGRGTFEIIAGHRRVKACQLLEMSLIPAFIRDLTQEEAVIFMVDTNIQRQSIRPSEKAFAYQMKLDAIRAQKKQGLTAVDTQNLPEEQTKGKARDLLATFSKESSVQIQRYLRLTQLDPVLRERVDEKKLPFQVGVALSYLTSQEQELIVSVIERTDQSISLEQAHLFREESQKNMLTQEKIIQLLEKKTTPKKPSFTLTKDVRPYFPPHTSTQKMEEKILQLLEQWHQEQGRK